MLGPPSVLQPPLSLEVWQYIHCGMLDASLRDLSWWIARGALACYQLRAPAEPSGRVVMGGALAGAVIAGRIVPICFGNALLSSLFGNGLWHLLSGFQGTRAGS